MITRNIGKKANRILRKKNYIQHQMLDANILVPCSETEEANSVDKYSSRKEINIPTNVICL